MEPKGTELEQARQAAMRRINDEVMQAYAAALKRSCFCCFGGHFELTLAFVCLGTNVMKKTMSVFFSGTGFSLNNFYDSDVYLAAKPPVK